MSLANSVPIVFDPARKFILLVPRHCLIDPRTGTFNKEAHDWYTIVLRMSRRL